MNNSLVSIIVPIYKVEDYLDECVDSIVNQTYKNLEILLVDDGSPDACPKMCDEWKIKDRRIHVIHKKNGGLSDARNVGLDNAKGDYIAFVDSDDFIKNTMIEDLLYALKKNEKTCAIANGRVLSDRKKKIAPYKESWNIQKDRVIASCDFATLTLTTRIGFTVWSKLYTADVVKNVRFRVGKTNEDTLFMFDLSKVLEQKNKGMIDIAKDVYFYRIRENSICTTSKKPLEIDVVNNFTEITNYFKSIGDEKRYKVLEVKRISVFTQLITKLLSTRSWEQEYWNMYYPVFREIPLLSMIFSSADKKLKLDFICHKYFPFISKMYLHHKYKQ